MDKYSRKVRAAWPSARVAPGFLLALCCLCAVVQAAPFTPTPLHALTAAANVILVGTVTEVIALAPENPYGNYEAALRVDEALKGTPEPSVRLRYPGPPMHIPGRGTAQTGGVSPYRLAVGQQRIFLLDGAAPYRLAHLRQGIRPLDDLPALRAALASYPLTFSVQAEPPRVTAGQSLIVTIRLAYTGAEPLQVYLPRVFDDGCRLRSWSTSAHVPDKVLRLPALASEASGFVPVTLQPGDSRVSIQTLQVVPLPRLPGPQSVSLVAYLSLLSPGALAPHYLASPPTTVTITPATP